VTRLITTNKDRKILSLIMLLGILLRLYGIFHGFPYIFHPDEPALVRSGIGIRFQINPHHFDWPHLYFYVNYFLYSAFAYGRDILVSVGLKATISNLIPLLWNDKLIFYYLSRILTSAIGAITVVPIYLAAKELFSNKAGLMAALAVTLTPLLVIYSKLALPDIPMLFFMCWYIYFSSKIYKNATTKDYILAGIFLGLSASTKYHGELSFIYIVLIHLYKYRLNLNNFLNLLLTGLFSIIGLLIGSPFILLDFNTFIRHDSPQGALWQFTNVGNVSTTLQIKAFLNYFSIQSAENSGYYILYALIANILITMLLIIIRKTNENTKKLIFLYIPAITFIYIISGFSKNMPHYYFIAYPFLILGFSYLSKNMLDYIPQRALKILILIMIFIPMLLISIKKTNELMNIRAGTAYGGEISKYTEIID